jgi:predicted N-acyltransferase
MSVKKYVQVVNSVDHIRESIDQLSDDSFFTYGWFKTLESIRRISDPLYFVLDYEGKKVGIAPCFMDKTKEYFSWGPNIFPFFSKLLYIGKKLRLFNTDFLLCYSPACCRTKLLVKGGFKNTETLNIFSNEIDKICKKHKVLFSSFLFVSEFDELLMNNLSSLNYAGFPNILTFYLDIKWSSFEDYIQSLKRPTLFRREIKEFSKSGVIIQEESITIDLAEKLSSLQANVSLKYGESVKLDPSFFIKLNEFAGDKVRLLVARKNSEAIGFGLFLQHKEMLDAYMCGFDYAALANVRFLYFNLAFYRPIQLAIQEKKRKIYFRYFLHKARLSRGCTPEQTYSFIKCQNVFLAPFVNRLLKSDLYNKAKTRYLHDYFPT